MAKFEETKLAVARMVESLSKDETQSSRGGF